MTLSSPQFCDTCGAANRAAASFCTFCGQALRTPVSVPLNNSTSSTLTGRLSHQTTLKQRYIILMQAGQGGFGAVYKAADSQFGNRLVAVKEMSQNNLAPQELVEATASFKHEALLLAGLTHPNLPRIYEQFTDTGRSYLVMDFIEGETLEAYLNRLGGKKLSLEKVFDIGIQLCSVLDYLHTRQPPIIFRDLKPANVMVTSAGHIYLIDFGIARHFKPGQSKDTTALGSSGYAAPEQYGKSQTTARADIYSLGATLHQMLSGNDPADSPFQFAPLQADRQPLPTGLDKLLMSMVSVDVNKRPTSSAVVQQALQHMITQYRIAQTHPLPYSLASTLPPLPPQTKPPRATGGTKQASLPQVQPQANMLYVCCGHSSRITAVAWSLDGKYIASASYDKTVRVWDADTGKHLLTYKGHFQRVNALAWSPDSKHIASASDDRSVQIWNATNGNMDFSYYGHNGQVHAVAWSPDRMHIASGGEDKTVQVWHAHTHGLMYTYRNHTDRVQAIVWSPNSKRVASAGKDRKIQVWEALREQQKRSLFSQLLFPHQMQKTLERHHGQIYGLSWSADGRQLVSVGSDRRILVWNMATGTLISAHSKFSSGIPNNVDWSPRGRYLAVGSNDRTVQIWDTMQNAPPFTYCGHTGYVMTVGWSPDGSRVASAGVDRTLQVWRAV